MGLSETERNELYFASQSHDSDNSNNENIQHPPSGLASGSDYDDDKNKKKEEGNSNENNTPLYIGISLTHTTAAHEIGRKKQESNELAIAATHIYTITVLSQKVYRP